jgi:trigger factor
VKRRKNGRGCQDLRSEIISQEKNKVKILIEVQKETLARRIEETAEELRAKANIKGFRKGRVPRKVLEMHLGMDYIRSEAIEKMLPEYLDSVIKEYELDLIADPSLEIDRIEHDSPLRVTATFETRPEVRLPELDSVTVISKTAKVTDHMVDEAIERMRERHASSLPVSDRVSRKGDIVELEYSVTLEGETKDPDGNGKKEQKGTVEIGSDSLDPAVSSALEGQSAGDEVAAEVLLMAEGEKEEKKALYRMKVLSVSEKVLPELGAEFYEKITGEKETTAEAFRERITLGIQENFDRDCREMTESNAIVAVTESSEVEIPESLVTIQKEENLKKIRENIKKKTGQELEEYLSANGLEMEKIEKDAEESAVGIVKRSLVMEALGERENIISEKSDIDKEILDMAESFRIDVDQMRKFYLKKNSDLSELIHRIRIRKTVACILEKAEIREEEILLDNEEVKA